nr:FecR family protein [uncultured Arsenicibacter sp.]
MDYQRYTVHDFLQDDYFVQWVLNPTDSGDRYWQRIRRSFPELDETMAEAMVIIQQLHANEHTPVTQDTVDTLWAQIEQQTSPDMAAKSARWYIPIGVLTVLLVVFVVWGARHDLLPFHSGTKEWISRTNLTDKPVWVNLPDSSWVSLLPGSRIEYAIDPDFPVREVTLHGQAFFDVKRNPDWPFQILTGKTQTQVLGTSFWIKEHTDQKSIEVDVVSGKVSVSKMTKPVLSLKEPAMEDVVILPNQRVLYDEAANRLTVSLVDHPVRLQTGAGKEELQFRDTPLSLIAPHLSRLYGISVIIANPKTGRCMFTGDVNGMALYDILNLVCRSIGAAYHIQDTRIVISGKGCR